MTTMAADVAQKRFNLGRRALRVARVLTADGTVVCERCEIADRPLARMRGLLGRDGLEPGGGMLLTPESSVHMLFMRFAIDVVFLDRDHKVVGVRHDLRPWRAAGARGAYASLELPAGAAADIEEGDQLVIQDLAA
jgi:uncharacterized membrane protein (UPF0127 family)